ncbi:hypothetical protein Dacet_1744 [Denitrovibrio acetiphilus DSM 12809]|uniref:Uncharacterized protein n=1 Tax=Denitrovibrio acetiphilus (strain DSM 12809 / NBRC 114555 / N2460) TaxID=522772 RepID=D4H0J5_DENA2|nr:redoxin domain-containing protein [Denitrovibrio acetiphilus]ADD68508.1 hypothetical protein Dacet_1744 [Denitrovibrio acetiphilus DSM 12809]
MRFKNLVNSKSILVFILVGLSFHMLYKYRANVNVLEAGLQAPDLAFETLDGQKFDLYDFNSPVMLVFLNTKTLMSSALYPDLLLKRIPKLKLIEKRNIASLIVMLDTKQTPEAVMDKIRSKKYKILENTVYLSNIEVATEKYGLSSWPHFFLIDSTHNVIYESKIPSVSVIDSILEGS